MDVNAASYSELLRVPGIGPVSARRILEARGDHNIFSLEQLRKMRVNTKQAAPFIRFQGTLDWERQYSFMPQLSDELDEKPASLSALCGSA